MDDDIERAEARLKAEREALAARARARREQAAADERRSHQIGAELHRLSLLRLVGVPDGVRLAFRRPSWSKDRHPHEDMPGTLLAVRRTRCTVRFVGVDWDYAVRDLQPADKEQGLRMSFAEASHDWDA